VVALAIACLAAALTSIAFGANPAFPGSDPDESVRLNTPDDPRFDRCEPDDEETPARECTNVFDEELERFGFAPDTTQLTATYRNDGCLLISTCGDPHTLRLMQQNETAGRNPAGQLSGVSADRAWKYSVGDPSVQVAILDTGIRWNNGELRSKIALNRDELPQPHDGASECAYDCNGDGAFNVDDYAGDPAVSVSDGHEESDDALDASDLIADFSDGSDADSNGFVDDIAGWDFFDDDNDPYDASSYSSASNHGSGRAEEAGAETNNATDGTGVCPGCQIVPMRVWDTFVVDTNNFAQATIYAADNEIEVVEGAVGGLFNSRFATAAFDYAYTHGTFMAIVSSDLNTADHNIPTYYDEAMQVQGSVADQHGLGQDLPACPSFPGCEELRQFLLDAGVPTNAPVGTWFRNSGTTQYGGHAHIVMPASTGSQATGQAAGAAGLLISYARQLSRELEPNEVKQILTLTGEDVLPENTTGAGVPDPAQRGWDQHFGYGRPDLGLAMEAIDQNEIPPQALIKSPEWFAPLNVERQSSAEIGARLSARTTDYDWELQWAPGIEPCEGDFATVARGSEAAPRSGSLGSVDLEQVRDALDSRTSSSSCPTPSQPVEGGSTPDPTAPSKGPGDGDPNEPAFTVRVVVTDDDGNQGEDRKTLFAYRDTTLHQGWSRKLGTGGEASQRMFDLDGDNQLELVEANSSGELQVLRADGTPLPGFNGGQPVETLPYPNWHVGVPAAGEVPTPREVLRTPGIGDIDGDLEPEIVDSAGEHVYAWEVDGSPVAGFPVRLDLSFSEPADRTRSNHVKRGFFSSPALGDLDGDGDLEITAAALDQHLYAWRGDGTPVPGFPVLLREEGSTLVGAESINTPAIGDIAGDERPEIVVATNELEDDPAAPGTPTGPFDLLGGVRGLVINVLANALGGSGRVYAVQPDGDDAGGGPFVPGWPIKPNGALPDALPLVGPGVDQVLGDVGADSKLDVIGNVTSGDVQATDGAGGAAGNLTTYDSSPASGDTVDKSKVLNLFENPIVADFDSASPGLEVLKGGATLNQLLNLGVTVGQNLPYNHALQAWNGQTGFSLPAYPQAVEDYQLLSSPAVADVSDAGGAEAIAGNGLYFIRDLNAQGEEGSDWPKFTGGWNFAVPSIGDIDRDGELEVSAITREGFSFLWDTDRPACGGNEQWWTSRHDEWSTGAYGTDTRPPGSPESMLAARNAAGGVDLTWTAPGDDWLCGKAELFRVIVSRNPIVHPSDGVVVQEQPADSESGQTQPFTLSREQARGIRFAAVLYRDDTGNWGLLRQVAVPPPGGGGRGP
jgi:hypothetical protein